MWTTNRIALAFGYLLRVKFRLVFGEYLYYRSSVEDILAAHTTFFTSMISVSYHYCGPLRPGVMHGTPLMASESSKMQSTGFTFLFGSAGYNGTSMHKR